MVNAVPRLPPAGVYTASAKSRGEDNMATPVMNAAAMRLNEQTAIPSPFLYGCHNLRKASFPQNIAHILQYGGETVN